MEIFILILFTVIFSFLLLFFFFLYQQQKKAVQRLNNGSLIASTSKGSVEYAILGNGPVILSLHGGVGGWDQGIVIAQNWLNLANHGFSILSLSRPGYLRTPLETGKSPEEAADAIAALLDTLGIDKVSVLGTSGGGPTALQFALRYPDRTRCLILFSAISLRHIQPGRTRKNYGWFLFSKYSAYIMDTVWLILNNMLDIFPRLMIKSIFKATSTDEFKINDALDYVMTNKKAFSCIKDLMNTQIPLSTRKPGLDNDLMTFAKLESCKTEQISCRALIVHGRLDGNVPFSHAEFTSGTIPHAELYVVENAGHLTCTAPGADQMRFAILEFLKKNNYCNE